MEGFGTYLVCRREKNGVVLLRVQTAQRDLILPETVEGLPVVALGDRALAPDARPPEGEDLLVLGDQTGDYDNRAVRAITLPSTLERVGNYAFYNCTGLEKLVLTDRTRHWGGDCLMNCRKLHALEITARENEVSETLCYFAGELSTELDVAVRFPDGEDLRLIFPEYIESYENNDPAHHFDFHLYGPGFPYHHAFQSKKLDLGLFDGAWEETLRREHDPDCILRLAWYRLRYPRALSARGAENYRAYLAERVDAVLAWLLTQGDCRGLSWYLGQFKPGKESLTGALSMARDLRLSEAVALLLEEQHRRTPVGRTKSFDL